MKQDANAGKNSQSQRSSNLGRHDGQFSTDSEFLIGYCPA